MARQELRPEDLVAICDTREQTPLDLSPIKTARGTLTTGDYSVAGLENIIAVERKSLDDLLGCIGRERERFDREMHRIVAYPCRMLVIEATWLDICAGTWRSKVHPNAVRGSILGWMAAGMPIFFAQDHATAGRIVAHFLWISARRRWEEACSMVPHLKIATEKDNKCDANATAPGAASPTKTKTKT